MVDTLPCDTNQHTARGSTYAALNSLTIVLYFTWERGLPRIQALKKSG